MRFEQKARRVYSSLRGRPFPRFGAGGFKYDAALDVPYYPRRAVAIVFRPGSVFPIVYADGPVESPHRFDDTGSLCMWVSDDPQAHRWDFNDGLLDLLDAIVAHLFREAWWRETGEWLGDEVRHRARSTPGSEFR